MGKDVTAMPGMSAVIFVPDDTAKTGLPRPLLLQQVLGAPLLAWHLSGGTTELLLAEPSEERILRASILGGSSDISAGLRMMKRLPYGPYRLLSRRDDGQGRVRLRLEGRRKKL